MAWHCNCAGIICKYCCSRQRKFWSQRESAKNNSWWNFAIIIQGSLCILLGYVLLIAKVSVVEVGAEVTGGRKTLCIKIGYSSREPRGVFLSCFKIGYVSAMDRVCFGTRFWLAAESVHCIRIWSRVNILREVIAFGSSSQCIKIWTDSFFGTIFGTLRQFSALWDQVPLLWWQSVLEKCSPG